MADDTLLGGDDAAEFIREGKLGKKLVCFNHLNRLSELCVHEFTPGFREIKPVKTPTGVLITEVYHEDRREAYSNAVEFLYMMVLPDSDEKFDTDTRELIKTFETEYKVVISNQKQSDAEKENKIKMMRLALSRKLFNEICLMMGRVGFWAKNRAYREVVEGAKK